MSINGPSLQQFAPADVVTGPRKVERFPPADPIENPRWETVDDKIKNTKSQIVELIFYLEDKEHFFRSVKLLKSERKRNSLLNCLLLFVTKYTEYCEQYLSIKVKPYSVHEGKYAREALYDHARQIIKVLKYLSKKINEEVMYCATKQDNLFLINKSLLRKIKHLIFPKNDTK